MTYKFAHFADVHWRGLTRHKEYRESFADLFDQARSLKPDLIYAHWVMPQALIALICFKLTRVPFVFTSHAHDAEILTKLPVIGILLLNTIVKNAATTANEIS